MRRQGPQEQGPPCEFIRGHRVHVNTQGRRISQRCRLRGMEECSLIKHPLASPVFLGKHSNTKLMGILYLVIGWGRLLRHMTTFNAEKSGGIKEKGASSGDSLPEKIKYLKVREIKEPALREISVHFCNLRKEAKSIRLWSVIILASWEAPICSTFTYTSTFFSQGPAFCANGGHDGSFELSAKLGIKP